MIDPAAATAIDLAAASIRRHPDVREHVRNTGNRVNVHRDHQATGLDDVGEINHDSHPVGELYIDWLNDLLEEARLPYEAEALNSYVILIRPVH